ncbi:MAG: hypothetical protein ACUVV5_11045 [Candidatus Aminicenantales bacterium]
MRMVIFKSCAMLVLVGLSIASWNVNPMQGTQATEREPNNEARQANPLPLNTEIKGFVSVDGDEDWYELTIPAPGLDILVIGVSGVADIDLSLRLYDASRADEYIIEMDGNKKGEGEKIVRMR